MILHAFLTTPSLGQICNPPATVCTNNNNWDYRLPTNCNSAPYDGCSAGDVDLVAIRLVDPNQSGSCVTCTPGALVTWDLEVDLTFGQNGNRSCFALVGDLLVNGVSCCVFSRVNSTTCVSGQQGATETISFGTVTFRCGDELELTNVVVGWAANCNTACDDGIYCPISSKCSNPGNLVIKTPVGAICYEVPASCVGENGQVGVTARGGTPPYSYDWRDSGNNQVGTDPEITVPPGTYSVTVLDDEGCTTTCSITLTTAMDNEDPVITCPQTINVNNTPGQCGANVNFSATASDNCPGVIVTYSHQPNSFFPVGSTVVTATATDASNRTASCMFQINVNDTEVTAVCRDISIPLDASGNASITANQVNNGSSDNCNALSLSVNPSTFNCQNLGPNNVILTASDNNNNSDNCTAIVTVIDNLPPNAICVPTLTVPLDASGSASIVASQVDNGSNDNCGPPSLAISPSSFTCSDVGTPVQVTLTATDGSNNQNTCSTLVTVTDPVFPTVLTQDITIQLASDGTASITTNQIDNGSFDNCGILSMSVVPNTFTCGDVGANSVTLNVTDVNNNTSTNTATVTVEDNVNPIAQCQNLTIQLDASGTASITANDIDNGSTDNCGINSISVSPSTFSCANLGANPVTLTVTDVNGNTSSCSAMVTVEDNLAPMVSCPTNIVVDNDPGTCGAIVNYAANYSDNCSATDIYTPPSGSFFAIGTTTTVLVTVSDPSNNTAQCTFTVTVNDALAPGINCPPNVTISCEESSDPNNTGMATSSDICGGTGTITFSDAIAAGSCPNEMIITRTWTATDPNNNSTSCDQTITIVDNTPPTIACPSQINVACMGDVPPPNPSLVTTSDNCPGQIVVSHVSDVQSGNSPIIITRTYQAQDACQNTSICTQTIVVQNLTAPILTCPAPVSVQCLGDLPPADINDVIAQANCGGAVTVSHLGDTYSGTCPTTVVRTYQGVDQDNNVAICTQILTVYDTTRPVVTSCPIGVNFGCFTSGIPGTGDLPPAITSPIQLGATDNCTLQADLVVTYIDNGPTIDGCNYTFERIYSVTDECGNVTTCTPQIFSFVYDVTPPSFYDTPADQVYACGASIPSIPSPPKVNDECPGSITMSFSEVLTNQSCTGEAYHRIWTATDACGNVSTFTQIASKQDLTAPEIIRPNDTTIYCGQSIPAPSFEIIEDCPESRYTEEFKEQIIDKSCDCSYTLLRTWYVYNNCLAEIRDTQYVHVKDTAGPSISIVNPELADIPNGGIMVMYGCMEPGVLMSDIVVDDCCGVSDVQLYDSLIAYSSCEAFEYFALWACGYVATDHCGNTTEFKFYVHQIDTLPPEFVLSDDFESRIELACGDSTIMIPEVNIIDDCDLVPTIEYRADTVGFFPDSFAIIRTWEATDACLNADEVTQTITYCGFNPETFVGEIGNLVWLDENENGVQDSGEPGLNGFDIQLFQDKNSDGIPDPAVFRTSSSKTRKGRDGSYLFRNLEPGDYFLKAKPTDQWSLTTQKMGADQEMDSDIDPNTGLSAQLKVLNGTENLDVDIGVIRGKETINLVQISDFIASSRGCQVLLKWNTNLSENGQQFDVERSRDGLDYDVIGTIQTSGPHTSFEFLDKEPFGRVYYRLSYVDVDGQRKFSSSLYLANRCVDRSSFVLYPNPTKGVFWIKHQNDSEGPMKVEVTDVYGRLIKKWQIGKRYSGDIDDITLDQNPGLYWIKINDGFTQMIKSILILEN